MAATMEKTRHPGIYRRGGRYVVVWRHRGRQHKSFHRTLAEARAAQGARRAGDRTPEVRVTFEAYAGEWLETYRGRTNRGLGDLTRQDYRRSIDQHAVPFFRGMRLAEIEPPDVRRFIAELERQGNAPSSVRKRVAPLRALFATALEDGAIRTNPTAGVRVTGRTGEQPEEDRRALTRSELSTLLGELPEDWRLFFELLAHSGLRISEAIGLTWGDVQLGDRPRLCIRRQLCLGQWRTLKSRHARRDVPLSPAMARRLWVLRRGRREDDPLFASSTGSHLQASNVRRRVLKPAVERAGVPWAGFHTFRHTCASMLFEGERNVKQVQAWLGHHDAAFTLKTYVHLLDDGLGDAALFDEAVKVGNKWATEASGTGRNRSDAEAGEIAV